jgi:beta-galactosidase
MLGRPEYSERPKYMEALGQPYGLVLYRTKLPKSARTSLEIPNARDYALIFVDGKRFGVADRSLGQTKLDIEIPAGAPVDVLVEAMGRVNFGPRSVDDWKGMDEALLGGVPLRGWEHYTPPLDQLSTLVSARSRLPVLRSFAVRSK